MQDIEHPLEAKLTRVGKTPLEPAFVSATGYLVEPWDAKFTSNYREFWAHNCQSHSPLEQSKMAHSIIIQARPIPNQFILFVIVMEWNRQVELASLSPNKKQTKGMFQERVFVLIKSLLHIPFVPLTKCWYSFHYQFATLSLFNRCPWSVDATPNKNRITAQANPHKI